MSFKISGKYTFDADALAYITAVEAADGQPLELAVKYAIDKFVVNLKYQYIWYYDFTSFCILAGARTLQGALVPLKGPAPTNYNFTNADYDRKTGLLGSGNVSPFKYLDTNVNNNSFSLGSQSMSVYVSTAATTSGTGVYAVYIGAGDTNTGSSHLGRLTSNGGLYARSQSSTVNTFTTTQPGSSTGFMGIERYFTFNFALRANKLNTLHTRSAQTPYNGQIYVFWNGITPGTGSFYANARIAFYHTSGSLGGNMEGLSQLVEDLISTYASVIP